MLIKFFDRIATRLIINVILVATLIVTMSSYIFFERTYDVELKNNRASIQQLIQAVSHTAAIAMYLDNKILAKEVIDGIASNDLVKAVVLRTELKLVANSGEINRQDDVNLIRLRLYSPFIDTEYIGELIVDINDKLIQTYAENVAFEYVVLITIYSLILILVIISLLKHQLVDVIKMLADKLHNITPGTDQRIVLPTEYNHNEIGLLGTDINQLLSSVEVTLSRERALRTDAENNSIKIKTAQVALQALKSTMDEHSLVSITDIKGTISYANTKFCTLSGYNQDELIGANHRLLNSKHHTNDYWREMYLNVSKGMIWNDDVCNLAKDGQEYWVNTTIVPQYEDGTLTGYTSIRTDITERKNNEAKLEFANKTLAFQNSELDSYRVEMEIKVKARTRELDTIFTLSPDGFVLVNADNNIAYINPAFSTMTGLKKESFIGKNAQVFIESMERLFDPEYMDDIKCIGSEDAKKLIYLLYPRPRIINVNIRTMVGLTGEKEGQVLYFRDVTHETEVDKMKSDFLSTAAHELRTPLASIYGFSELLLVRDYDKSSSHDIIETIHRQSLNLKKLLDELLDLSRIEARAGKDFYMVNNSLKEVVNQSCIEVEGAFMGRKVEIQSLEDWPIMSFDSDKMRQVFNNLLSNAFKYSQEDKSVLLKTSEREKDGNRQFGVSIIDNGIGMPPEQLARIGERFYRADDSGLTPGTGLGVSLVKEIVSIHGGETNFISAMGKGMAVTVWLPIVKNQSIEE